MDAESYWQGYLAARKERFFKEKAIIIGTEYKSSKKYWDEIINGEWIIFESRLPKPKLGLYDNRITEGVIGVLVNTDESQHGQVEDLMNRSGAIEVKGET